MLLGQQSISSVEHIANVRRSSRDDGDAHHGAPVEVVGADFSCGSLSPPTQIGDERPKDAALLLQGVHVAEKQVELDPPDPHASESARRWDREVARGGGIRRPGESAHKEAASPPAGYRLRMTSKTSRSQSRGAMAPR